MPDLNERPVIANSPLSVILLAHALAAEAADGLKSWRTYLETLHRPFEIILLQETRPDVPVAAETTEPISTSRVITFNRDVGYRDALNAAIAGAQHPLLVFSTCDKQFEPGDLERMLKLIDKVDLVVGYRTGEQAPPWRVILDIFGRVFSRVFLGIPLGPRVCWLGSSAWSHRFVARWIFGVRVLDPECPFRVARRDVFKHWPLQSGGPFVQVEMLAKANHLTCLLSEEAVRWSPPMSSANPAISFRQDAWLVFRTPDFGPLASPSAETPPEISVPPQA